ncbi:hypothetical protein ACFPIJ_09725 [Dactylosporangium cerinum]|uniref:Uncharacterized protein n=1 Tax=Dactylosporangium cerinum TaxID=1434730 RepID=A0ABV9VQP8_9ACTN
MTSRSTTVSPPKELTDNITERVGQVVRQQRATSTPKEWTSPDQVGNGTPATWGRKATPGTAATTGTVATRPTWETVEPATTWGTAGTAADLAASSISGAFDLEIEVNGKTYIVTVSSPATPGDPYVLEFTYEEVKWALTVRWPAEEGEPYDIKLKRTAEGETTTIAGVEYTDSETWAAELELPKMEFGTITISRLAFRIASIPSDKPEGPLPPLPALRGRPEAYVIGRDLAVGGHETSSDVVRG